MSAIAETPFDAVAGDRLAKRNALVLAAGQALAGANNTVIVTTGSIVGAMFAPDKSLATMLVNHELDAAPIAGHLTRAVNVIDRSTRIRGGEGDWSKVKPLFPDPIAEATRFFTKYGFVPVNHTYIVRGDVYRAHPWVAVNLYAAFVKAKAYAREKLLERIPEALFFGPEYLTMTQQILGDDPFPYGVKANAAMLDTIIGYSNEQGLTPRKMKVDELFAEETLDL